MVVPVCWRENVSSDSISPSPSSSPPKGETILQAFLSSHSWLSLSLTISELPTYLNSFLSNKLKIWDTKNWIRSSVFTTTIYVAQLVSFIIRCHLLSGQKLYCSVAQGSLNLIYQNKQVAKEGIPLPPDRTICPLCSQKRANPSVVTVSGFVFCYACIFKYITQVISPASQTNRYVLRGDSMVLKYNINDLSFHNPISGLMHKLSYWNLFLTSYFTSHRVNLLQCQGDQLTAVINWIFSCIHAPLPFLLLFVYLVLAIRETN